MNGNHPPNLDHGHTAVGVTADRQSVGLQAGRARRCSTGVPLLRLAGRLRSVHKIMVTHLGSRSHRLRTWTLTPERYHRRRWWCPRVSRTLRLPIGRRAPQFGLQSFELAPFNENGTPATQAGAHPFQLTTTLVLNQKASRRFPVELPKDLRFHLPPGLLGTPTVGRLRCSIFSPSCAKRICAKQTQWWA